jgi:DNA-damage-inducible protein D
MSNLAKPGKNPFDSIKHVDDQGNEYWFARELMGCLEYSKWQDFNAVIDRSIESCEKGGISAFDQFTDVRKFAKRSQGGGKARLDYKLTRYACYLIAQNGDPTKKETIAKAQSYFAVQTRKQEIHEIRAEEDKRLEARAWQKSCHKKFHGSLRKQGIVFGGQYAKFNNLRTQKLHKTTVKSLKQKRGIDEGTALAETFNHTELVTYAYGLILDTGGIENKNLTTDQEIRRELSANGQSIYDQLASKDIYLNKMEGSENLLEVQKRRKKEEKVLASGHNQELIPGLFDNAIKRAAPPTQ